MRPAGFAPHLDLGVWLRLVEQAVPPILESALAAIQLAAPVQLRQLPGGRVAKIQVIEVACAVDARARLGRGLAHAATEGATRHVLRCGRLRQLAARCWLLCTGCGARTAVPSAPRQQGQLFAAPALCSEASCCVSRPRSPPTRLRCAPRRRRAGAPRAGSRILSQRGCMRFLAPAGADACAAPLPPGRAGRSRPGPPGRRR